MVEPRFLCFQRGPGTSVPPTWSRNFSSGGQRRLCAVTFWPLLLVLPISLVVSADLRSARDVRRSEIAKLLDALGTHAPADAPAAAAGETHWAAWVHARDAAVRARVLRAEEDSLAYLLVYGTSF